MVSVVGLSLTASVAPRCSRKLHQERSVVVTCPMSPSLLVVKGQTPQGWQHSALHALREMKNVQLINAARSSRVAVVHKAARAAFVGMS